MELDFKKRIYQVIERANQREEDNKERDRLQKKDSLRYLDELDNMLEKLNRKIKANVRDGIKRSDRSVDGVLTGRVEQYRLKLETIAKLKEQLLKKEEKKEDKSKDVKK